MYTQLAFSPYSSKRKTLFQQARFLLHELVNDQVHKYPCLCGACIYAAYRRDKKTEGRSFSKSTFFVFFLRSHFLESFWLNKELSRPLDNPKTSDPKVLKAREKFWSAKRRPLFSWPPPVGVSWWIEEWKVISRKRTLDLIKKLAEEEHGRTAKRFLKGILRKKSFYTYYRRAGDEALYRLVNKIQGMQNH